MFALELQFRRSKIEEKAIVPICSDEVVNDLNFVCLRQTARCFEFTEQEPINDDIGNEVANNGVLVANFDALSSFNGQSGASQFVHEGIQVN